MDGLVERFNATLKKILNHCASTHMWYTTLSVVLGNASHISLRTSRGPCTALPYNSSKGENPVDSCGTLMVGKQQVGYWRVSLSLGSSQPGNTCRPWAAQKSRNMVWQANSRCWCYFLHLKTGKGRAARTIHNPETYSFIVQHKKGCDSNANVDRLSPTDNLNWPKMDYFCPH